MTGAAISREQMERFDHTWSSPTGWLGPLRTINNIPIAQRYMATGFFFFLVGGVEALLLRIQLGTPENTFLDPETYNQIFTMHGTTMMFLFVIPFIEAIANYVLPLLLGTRDLPFPRLTALSYWTYVLGGLFLYSSFLFGVAPDGGWFAYVPLTNREFSPGINMDFWDIGLSVAEVAAIGAAAEMIVAILRVRAVGMSLNRMPLFVWAMLVTGCMIIFAFTTLIVGTAMLEFDRKGITSFFVPSASGEPLLWQHLFWVFGHPEVYIMFVPAVGIVSHVVQTFARRPVVGYTLLVLSAIATGFLSFGLWVHHMFTTGLPAAGMGFFTAASMVIAIPNGVQVFAWIATLWTGRPVWRVPLLFVGGFLVIFVIGGVTGVMVGAVPFDWQVHDTYFVVAHFHYVLIGGVLFPLIAGLYYWLPKITGRLLSERLGRWNFWMMFVFFNVAFFPMHFSGMLGMPRRVYTYPAGMGLEPYNLISTIGAIGFAVGVLLFVANFLWSLRHGEAAGADPWDGDTLEWSESSPPASAQFRALPAVRSRHPMWDRDGLTPPDGESREVLDALHYAPAGWRGALVVTAVDARPLALVHVPGPTIWPFVMSLGFVLIFAGALVERFWLFAAGAGVTAVALVGWFWPQESERRALDEYGARPLAGRVPLVMAGPQANGYWGTCLFLVILATALACLLASYFYLAEGPLQWPPPGAGLGDGFLVLGAHAAIAAAALALRRSVGPGARDGRGASLRRLAALGGLAAAVAAAWLLRELWRTEQLQPLQSAYASIVLFLLVYQALVLLVFAAMIVGGAIWAWRAPADPRGHAYAHHAALVGYYLLASWIVIMLAHYLAPVGRFGA